MLLLVGAAVSLAGCPESAVCTFRGSINDPANRTMRRSLMNKGLGEFCTRMRGRSVPLRMYPESPAVGRFFPQDCARKELDNGDQYVEFAGFGYAYTNVSKKLTFTMSAAVEYNQDFLVSDKPCAVYAYFRPRNVVKSDFRTRQVENAMASLANTLTGVGDSFGKNLVSGRLAEGFTVIREGEQEDFSFGIVPLGKKPARAFAGSSERLTYENERVEVSAGQRDFIGPISITEGGRAVFVQANLDGASALHIALLSKEVGEASLAAHFNAQTVPPLSGPPVAFGIAQQRVPFAATFPVPPGTYYVVLDNNVRTGSVLTPNAQSMPAAVVSYLVQIGDAP